MSILPTAPVPTVAQLLRQVAEAANAADSLETALQRCLEGICSYLAWPVGHVRLLAETPESRLHPTPLWYIADPERYAALRRATEQLPEISPAGLPGRALQRRQPVWITDAATDNRFKRRETVAAAGLHAALAFPIEVDGEPIAILEFFGEKKTPPDEALLEAVAAIGTQLGHVIVRKRAERALLESEARLRGLFDSSLIGIVYWDRDQVLTDANDTFLRITGYARSDLTKLRLRIDTLTPPEYHNLDARAQREVEKFGHCVPYEKEYRRSDGSRVAVLVGAAAVEHTAGKSVGFALDVSERRRIEAQLDYLAHHDLLTGIPNRSLFIDRLQQAIVDATRRERLVAVMFLDIDRFKTINDTLGHAAGDVLLKQVAQRLNETIRKADTIARLSGDEFTLVISDMRHVDDAARVAQKILAALAQPFTVNGRELFVSASIGITVYPFDDDSVDILLRNADLAMYRAKELGRNTYQFYAVEMTQNAQQRLSMENALRHALLRQEFVLYYHPIVDLSSGELAAVEALIRWHHPQWGIVAPESFIPLAEETGMIVPIGEWVIDTACRQLAQWRAQDIEVRMGINISARQFDPNLIQILSTALRQHRINAAAIDLEITESLLMKSADATAYVLDELSASGFKFAIDDFGTGYSSLSYLKRLPIDVVKIDQSFVRDIPQDADDAAIAAGIVALAHQLGIRVTAEGVETEAQLRFMIAHGCDSVQGYYFASPAATLDLKAIARELPARLHAAGWQAAPR